MAVLFLPRNETLFHGMLVISPLTSLFKIICLALAFFTILLTQQKGAAPYRRISCACSARDDRTDAAGRERRIAHDFYRLELTRTFALRHDRVRQDGRRSAEAGLKYFLFGSTASAFTLFGISLIYGMREQPVCRDRAETGATSVQPLLAVGIVMTLIGFAFKIAAAPFHLWAPDAYQGAPVPSAAFIASGSKVASFVGPGKLSS